MITQSEGLVDASNFLSPIYPVEGRGKTEVLSFWKP